MAAVLCIVKGRYVLTVIARRSAANDIARTIRSVWTTFPVTACNTWGTRVSAAGAFAGILTCTASSTTFVAAGLLPGAACASGANRTRCITAGISAWIIQAAAATVVIEWACTADIAFLAMDALFTLGAHITTAA